MFWKKNKPMTETGKQILNLKILNALLVAKLELTRYSANSNPFSNETRLLGELSYAIQVVKGGYYLNISNTKGTLSSLAKQLDAVGFPAIAESLRSLFWDS